MQISDDDTQEMQAVIFVCKNVFYGGQDSTGVESHTFPFNSVGMEELPGIRYRFLDDGRIKVLLLIIDGPKYYSGDTSFKDLTAVNGYRQWIKNQAESVLQISGQKLASFSKIYVCSHFGGGMKSGVELKSSNIQKLNELIGGDETTDFRFCNISENWKLPSFLYLTGLHAMSAQELIRQLDEAIEAYACHSAWFADYEHNMKYAYERCIGCGPLLNRISSRKQNDPKNRSLILLVARENDEKSESILKMLHEKIKDRKDVRVAIVSSRGAAVVDDDTVNGKYSKEERDSNIVWCPNTELIREFQLVFNSSVNLFAFLPVKPRDSDKLDVLLAPWTVLSVDRLVYGYYPMSNTNVANARMLLDMFSHACVDGPYIGVPKLMATDLYERQKSHYYEIMKGMGHGDD